MNKFMNDNVFLSGEMPFKLYDMVSDIPIYDYHCHLNPKEIREDRRFNNIGELWLEGDHYKWRLMRAAGLDERLITGSANFDEKFLAFASILPLAAGNPIYHWAHMELKTYFDINEPLNAQSAPSIMERANRIMAKGEFTARALMRRSKVKVVCTTDDPADTLEHHIALNNEGFDIKVCPTFRPDRAVCGLLRHDFSEYVKQLTGKSVSFDDFLIALVKKLDFFYEQGCRISDISLTRIPKVFGSREQAAVCFDRAIGGEKQESDDEYTSFLFSFLAGEYRRRNMAMQVHLSALRNNSTRLFDIAGVDSGNDSVASHACVEAFGSLLNGIEQTAGIPKTIVYTLNPTGYYELSTMIGNFQGGNGGRLQLGAAWWFCDHADGIMELFRILAATGLLGTFNGMLTDSRSFTSYVRHDYFRRLLCSFVGSMVDRGEYDAEAAESIVKNICFDNANMYFEIER